MKIGGKQKIKIGFPIAFGLTLVSYLCPLALEKVFPKSSINKIITCLLYTSDAADE